MTATFDVGLLEAKVKQMHTDVAREPHGAFHFELGEGVALRVRVRPMPYSRATSTGAL
jgi:hypothetical protein